MTQGPDQITGRGDQAIPLPLLPSDLLPLDRERLAVISGVLDRIYESDEFAEAERKQALGQAEIAYDTFNPNDSNRLPFLVIKLF